MTDLRRPAAVCALALGLAAGLSACSGSSSGAQVTLVDWGSQGGPRQWATAGTTPTDASPARSSVVMDKIPLTPDDKGNAPSEQWPDAKDLLTEPALKALFPDGKEFETKDCAKGHYEDGSGSQTAKNTRCTFAVSLPDDSGGKSTVRVSLRAAGADDSMTKSYERENGDLLNTDNAKGSSTDRVWRNGAFGAKRLVKSGFDYRVLTSDGKNAIYYVVQLDGFNVFGQSMAERQKNIEAKLLPYLVQDLAWRQPAA